MGEFLFLLDAGVGVLMGYTLARILTQGPAPEPEDWLL